MYGYASTGPEREVVSPTQSHVCCEHCCASRTPPAYVEPEQRKTDDPANFFDAVDKKSLIEEAENTIRSPTRTLSQHPEETSHAGSPSATAQPYFTTSLPFRPPKGLNIVMQVAGTTADIEPFVALGWLLKHKYQHRVRVATHPNLKTLVEGTGLEFFSIGGDGAKLKEFLATKPELLSSLTVWNDEEVQECTKDIYTMMERCWRSCYQAGYGNDFEMMPNEPNRPLPPSHPNLDGHFGADIIIANPSSFAHVHCAQKLGIPVHIISTPTHNSLSAMATTSPGVIGEVLLDAASYTMLEMMNWRWLSNIVNKFRRKVLNMEAIRYAYRPHVFNTLSEPASFSEPVSFENSSSDTAARYLTNGNAPEFAVSRFHEQVQREFARCSLDADRVAVWRVAKAEVLLSAFSAVVLLNAGAIKLKDLHLYRQKEHNLEVGPFDPIAGTISAVMGMVGDMTEGFMDFPREIHRAVDIDSSPGPSKSTQVPAERNSPLDEVSPLLVREYYAPEERWDSEQSPTKESKNASHKQMPKRILKGTLGATLGTSKGVGRILMAGFKSPFQVSLEASRGFHNVPKLYGDPTVRKTQRITGFASGMAAAGKGFGLGLYDGIAGLVTQPMNGAKREGAIGVAKGIGWGIGGLAFKPVAGAWGLVGYSYEGINQEVQKLFGARVVTHMATSRLAQGFDEFGQATADEQMAIHQNWFACTGRRSR